MFGFVRRSECDALERRCREAEVQLSCIHWLCVRGGCDESNPPVDAVKQLIERVYNAASVVSEKEKLAQFNRGMLAEREAAKSRHAA